MAYLPTYLAQGTLQTRPDPPTAQWNCFCWDALHYRVYSRSFRQDTRNGAALQSVRILHNQKWQTTVGAVCGLAVPKVQATERPCNHAHWPLAATGSGHWPAVAIKVAALKLWRIATDVPCAAGVWKPCCCMIVCG